jgi:hypothetical protein
VAIRRRNNNPQQGWLIIDIATDCVLESITEYEQEPGMLFVRLHIELD